MTRKLTLRGAIRTLGVVEENRRLKARIRKLRKALREIANCTYCQRGAGWHGVTAAREALRRERAR